MDEWDGELDGAQDDEAASDLQSKIGDALAGMRVLQSRYIGTLEF